jgi:recombinational DNA repair ATPase RecF
VIRIEAITITQFRGIRDLTLKFDGNSFAICGPNGTGKSGVVDALEFVLTGNISRLTGEGRGDISLKQHGPHVDMRNNPDKARVAVAISIPSTKKKAVIYRTLKDPANSYLEPADPDVIDIVKQVAAHPEVVLSRRELIRYVLATPGKRAEEVRALLHLDQIEQVRAGLQKIANGCEKELKLLVPGTAQLRDNLLRAAQIPELTKEKLLAAANAQRALLGLPILSDMTESTSLKEGMSITAAASPQSVPKRQAIADIGAAKEILAEFVGAGNTTLVAQAISDLNSLSADPEIAVGVKNELFFKTGIELIQGEQCPFCDLPWDLSALKSHVQEKMERMREASQKRAAAEAKLAPIILTLRKMQAAINALANHAALMNPVVPMNKGHEFAEWCGSTLKRLAVLMPVDETVSILSKVLNVPGSVVEDIDRLKIAIDALPEPTKQDAARDWLTITQERLENWREARRKEVACNERTKRARQVSDIYSQTSDAALGAIYAAVEKDFSALYSFINRDDEDKFRAKLLPSMGKLGFDVDFYGRGFFPPGAYHSEGHQDGMGLCLYLALMRHVQGSGFTFAILDDVLMSVDIGHRREVCALLKSEFPNTQFVMTTHDPIWLRHMKTEGLIGPRSGVHFRNWSVDHGPTKWDDRDVWMEIEDYLNGNDVRAAAALLRHYLEYTAAELCHRLRAVVEYRADARYQLGELLPSAVSRLQGLYRKAKDAANSWNQKDIIDQLGTRHSEFSDRLKTSHAEEWQVNSAVHFNSWDNLGKEDFQAVVNAFRELLDGFGCSECDTYFRVLPDRETPEALRCDCGKANINLRKKETAQ